MRDIRRLRMPALRRQPPPLRWESEGWSGECHLSDLVAAGRAQLGHCSYGNPRVFTWPGDTTQIRVGNYSSLTGNADLHLGGYHRPDWVTTFAVRAVFELPGAFEDGHPISKGDIVIGHDVWLCPGSRVMSGITIGDGAVVAAGSIVTRDVAPFAIVAGNPAREIRRRFSATQIEALQAIRWWDWPKAKVIERVDLLCATDIDGFINWATATQAV